MKIILNRLIQLIGLYSICIAVEILTTKLKSKPLTVREFYIALIVAVVFWIVNIYLGKFKDWPFKKTNDFE
jgi:hypothetical protein